MNRSEQIMSFLNGFEGKRPVVFNVMGEGFHHGAEGRISGNVRTD
jgi:hypothetical protein